MQSVSGLADVRAWTHLPHAGALIPGEASAYAIGGRCDGGQTVAVDLLGIGSHAGDGEDLLVLLHALLQFPKEDS
jgi:hypothetical protein